MSKIKVVIDTNVFIKALIGSPSSEKIYFLFKEEAFQLAISEAMLEEISNVITRPKFNFPLIKTKRILEIIK